MTVAELRARMSVRELVQWDEWLEMRRRIEAPAAEPEQRKWWESAG